ncbi:unnamed protein product [Tilletia laevis]|uniref:Uncharacterized protein n=2 Tax=Tilletia TaxID=13289 RepID=A0A177TUV4_9BASI|nr:hypothetical protein CF335_g7286 [Tilletia laevis]KAE8245670.1 hypothetical protein A4X03_0g7455 [Tilletia caries]CAD6936555.1 unnamed protein product [Tilletia controversa]KAE8196132.1 hypothetical protein CF336_g2766 [Tilletia laevis]CAD6902031.1 unnamed protein product [Tilletia laevis]
MLSGWTAILTRLLRVKNQHLAALSHVLRGGSIKTAGMSTEDSRLAEAGLFGAHYVLPKVLLNHFLASVALVHDFSGPDKPIGHTIHVSTEAPKASPSLALLPCRAVSQVAPHPQPVVKWSARLGPLSGRTEVDAHSEK